MGATQNEHLGIPDVFDSSAPVAKQVENMKEILKDRKSGAAGKNKRQPKPQPDLKVVIGEILPCPDLPQRLARIYQLARRRAQEAQAAQASE